MGDTPKTITGSTMIDVRIEDIDRQLMTDATNTIGFYSGITMPTVWSDSHCGWFSTPSENPVVYKVAENGIASAFYMSSYKCDNNIVTVFSPGLMRKPSN